MTVLQYVETVQMLESASARAGFSTAGTYRSLWVTRAYLL